MALITVQDCVARVPQAAGNEAILADVVEEAEAMAGAYCRRTLASTAHTEYHDPTWGQTSVCLKQYPVVGSITVQLAANTSSPTTLTADTDYTTDTDQGIVSLLGGTFTSGPRNLKVTYTAGYTATTLPPAMRRALYQLVGWIIDSSGQSGAKTESMDGYSVTREELIDGIPTSIARALDPFRKVVV